MKKDSQILSYDFLVRHLSHSVMNYHRLRKVGRIISQMLSLIVFGILCGWRGRFSSDVGAMRLNPSTCMCCEHVSDSGKCLGTLT